MGLPGRPWRGIYGGPLRAGRPALIPPSDPTFGESAMRLARLASLAFGALLVAAAAGLARPALAQGQPTAFDDAERAAIEEIVRDYLVENPEVIREALQVLRERQEMAQQEAQQAQITALSDRLLDNPASPEMGNPDGDVTVVEFFDYNCGYCKQVREDVFTLVAEDPDLRVVFKELPILAPSSVTAARVALAAREQGLYVEVHNALMAHRGALDEDTIFALAEEAGADVDQLRIDMEDPAIDEAIAGNLELAQALGVRGTPAFVIGETLIPGAAGIEELRQAVDEARSG
jgi:protein-disulfide isomerase